MIRKIVGLLRTDISFLFLGKFLLHIFLAGLSGVGPPLLMPPILLILKDVWIRTQRAAVANRRATNPSPYKLSHPLPTNLATQLSQLPTNLAIHHPINFASPIPQLSRKLAKLFCCYQ